MEEEINTVLIGLCIVSFTCLVCLIINVCKSDNRIKGSIIKVKDGERLAYIYADTCINNNEVPMKDITYGGMLEYIESKNKSSKK